MTEKIEEKKKKSVRNAMAAALRSKIFQPKTKPSGKEYNRQKEKMVREEDETKADE